MLVYGSCGRSVLNRELDLETPVEFALQKLEGAVVVLKAKRKPSLDFRQNHQFGLPLGVNEDWKEEVEHQVACRSVACVPRGRDRLLFRPM